MFKNAFNNSAQFSRGKAREALCCILWGGMAVTQSAPRQNEVFVCSSSVVGEITPFLINESTFVVINIIGVRAGGQGGICPNGPMCV